MDAEVSSRAPAHPIVRKPIGLSEIDEKDVVLGIWSENNIRRLNVVVRKSTLVQKPKGVRDLLDDAEVLVILQCVVVGLVAVLNPLAQRARALEHRFEGEGELVLANPGKAAQIGVLFVLLS